MDQRGAGLVKYCAGRYRDLVFAFAALVESAGAMKAVAGVAAFGATVPAWPAKLEEVVHASLLIPEATLKLAESRAVLFHYTCSSLILLHIIAYLRIRRFNLMLEEYCGCGCFRFPNLFYCSGGFGDLLISARPQHTENCPQFTTSQEIAGGYESDEPYNDASGQYNKVVDVGTCAPVSERAPVDKQCSHDARCESELPERSHELIQGEGP